MLPKERYPRSFYLAILANLCFFTGFQWTFVTLPGYVQAIGGDAATIGLAFGLFSLSAVLVRPVVGWLVDHWGRKPVMILGASIFALAPVLYVYTPQVGPFLVVRVLHGLGIAAFTTAYTALVADLALGGRQGEAIGISGITNNLGMLFAPALGLIVVNAWGYPAHFWMAAAITAVSPLLMLFVREPLGAETVKIDNPRPSDVIRLRPVWVAAFGITGLAVAYGAVLGFLSPFAAERSLAAAGGYFSAFAAAMMVAQASAGVLSDRIGRRAVAMPGMIFVVVSMVGLAMARSDGALVATGTLFGLSWGLTRAGIDTTVVESVLPQARGVAIGLLYTCFDIGVGAGSYGLGVLAVGRDYGAVFWGAALWAILALLGYGVWGRRREPAPSGV
jgi:MFS family permease